MKNEDTIGFPGRFEGEIKLAEQSHDLVLERMARGRLPDSAVPKGDVSSLIDPLGEMLHIAAREEGGQKTSRNEMVRTVDELREAVDRIVAWPAAPLTMVIAPLVEMLEEMELEWLAIKLITDLPDNSALSEEELKAVEPALRRILPVHVRLIIEGDEWTPEFEAVLRSLRELALESPDNEDLAFTLRRAVVFHALRGRDALLTKDRRVLAAAEPLPDALAGALDEIYGEVFEGELMRLSLHLVLADIVAAGIAPDSEKPRSIVAAAYLALIGRDDPEERPDQQKFARWTQTRPQNLRKLKALVDPVFDWLPSDYDNILETRQQSRWRIMSGTIEFMPARWLPDLPEDDLPPYTTEAALARIEELPDVVWMMIDGIEAIRFVSEAFNYGGDTPAEIDEEIGVKAIGLWKKENLVTTEMDDDDWDNDDIAELDEEGEWSDE